MKMDKGFGTWNVINIYRTGSLRAAARELINDTLDLMRVQEIRRNRGGTEPAGDNTLFLRKWE
jgi:hypothetical protein